MCVVQTQWIAEGRQKIERAMSPGRQASRENSLTPSSSPRRYGSATAAANGDDTDDDDSEWLWRQLLLLCDYLLVYKAILAPFALILFLRYSGTDDIVVWAMNWWIVDLIWLTLSLGFILFLKEYYHTSVSIDKQSILNCNNE